VFSDIPKAWLVRIILRSSIKNYLRRRSISGGDSTLIARGLCKCALYGVRREREPDHKATLSATGNAAEKRGPSLMNGDRAQGYFDRVPERKVDEAMGRDRGRREGRLQRLPHCATDT
jgi:hypothetical protein